MLPGDIPDVLAHHPQSQVLGKAGISRVPYPEDKEMFWRLVELGGKMRHIHLMESEISDKYITQYPVDGDNAVINISAMPIDDRHVRADPC